jgi:hypothetical protein
MDNLFPLIPLYLFGGFFSNVICWEGHVWGRWAKNAPTINAKIFIGITCGVLWPLVLALFWTFHFLKGGFDLLPKRKPKIPEARIRHG